MRLLWGRKRTVRFRVAIGKSGRFSEGAVGGSFRPVADIPAGAGSGYAYGVYIRFVINMQDAQSGRRQGLFYAAYELEAAGVADPWDIAALADIHEWFAKNLREPTRAAISSRSNAQSQALSWFKETATEHVSRMRDMQRVLENYGIVSEALRTLRPGYVVYEDDHQAVAQPFADTPT